MSKELNIAVSGLNATDNPGPGIPIIRSLKMSTRFTTRIIGFCYESLEPGIFMNELIDSCYQLPYPQYGAIQLFERIQQINREEKLDVIIPCLDAEMPIYIQIEKQLNELGIKLFIPSFSQFECRQKYKLPQLAEKLDIKVPETHIFENVEDFYSFTKHFPSLIKGKYYEAYVVNNENEALKKFDLMRAKWGFPVLMQDYKVGTEFNVIGCGDGKGNIISNVAMRKTFITDKGKAWAGITIDNKPLLKIAEKFCKQTNWRGGFELELIKGNDTTIYLIEINPRIPAWVFLATGAGQNIPEQTVQLALGQEPSIYKSYKIGKMFVRYSYDMLIDQEDFSNFMLTKERH